MKRYPDGWKGNFFFQKDAPKHMPEWIPRRAFLSTSRESRQKRMISYPLVNDELAQLAALLRAAPACLKPVARRSSPSTPCPVRR